MLVDFADSSQSLSIRTDSATSVSNGVQGQQAQVIMLLLQMFLGCCED